MVDFTFRPAFYGFLLCGLAMMMAGQAVAKTLIVEKKKPLAVIVVAADQPHALEAGEAIQKYVQKISGATLPLITEGETMPADHPTSLWVGHTRHAAQLGIEIPKGYDPAPRDTAFDEEGFVLKTVKGGIIVAGNQDGPFRGTIYAAYNLLEQMGCRWYFPDEWGEVIPEAATIELDSLDVLSRPDFAVRKITLSGWIPTTKEERVLYHQWEDRVGFNNDQMYPLVGDGFLSYLIPSKDYFEEHPEWYALLEDGTRSHGYENHTMICLPNPEVYEQSVKNLTEAFAGKKKMRIVFDNGFGISPPDGAPWCYCEEFPMTPLNFNYPAYVHKPMMSEEYFSFASRLANEFPGKYASTMAYANREMPPQGVELPDNIMVMYAPIASDVLHPGNTKLWRRSETMKILQQWLDQTPHVTMYDYNPGLLTGMFVPERDSANMAINVPMYKEMGMKGMSREGRKAFMQTWLSFYVTAKLLWDADADVEALQEEFYREFFGEKAGKHVRAWWDACEKQLAATDMQAHEDFLINHIYDVSFVESIQSHIQDATKAAAKHSTEKQQGRVEVVSMIADHLMAFARMGQAEGEMDWAEAATQAEKMLALKHALHEKYSFLIEVHATQVRPYFAEGRAVHFREMAARADGTKGDLVANLSREMAFKKDPFNEGVVDQWYEPDLKEKGWEKLDTFYLWEQQMEPVSPRGHGYDGYGWYRDSFDVPANMKGRDVNLYIGGIVNEGWVWVNGQFVGHKAHDLWWSHANQLELDVTAAIKPGQPNHITIRVFNDAELGGIHRRAYLWSPVAEKE